MAKNPDTFPGMRVARRLRHLLLDIFHKNSTIQIMNGIQYYALNTPNPLNLYKKEDKHGEIRHPLTR